MSVLRGRDRSGDPAHVFGAERIHADDTTVKVLTKLKTIAVGPQFRTTFDDNELSTVKSSTDYS
jgi:hypothetical protein